MLSRFFLIILFSTPFLLFGNSTQDSLISELHNSTNDIEKLKIYRELYRAFKDFNSDSLYIFLQEEIQLSKRLEKHKSLGRALFSNGHFHNRKGKYDSAINNYIKAARIFKNLNMNQYYADALNSLGHISSTAGNYKSAINFFDKARIIYDHFQDERYLVEVLWNTGYCKLNLEDYDNAYLYYNSALALSRKLEDKDLQFKVFIYLGELSINQCRYNEARAYYHQASSLLNDAQLSDKAILSNNIGETYLFEKNYPLAEQYLNESIELKRQLANNDNSQMITLSQLGQLYLETGNINKAVNALERGMELADKNVINKAFTDAIGTLTEAYTAAVANHYEIDNNKTLALSFYWNDQHEKLWLLKERLKSDDIQNALYYRVEMDKMQAQIIEINKVNQYNFIIIALVTIIAFLILILYLNTRSSKQQVSYDLDNTKSKMEKAVKILKSRKG